MARVLRSSDAVLVREEERRDRRTAASRAVAKAEHHGTLHRIHGQPQDSPGSVPARFSTEIGAVERRVRALEAREGVGRVFRLQEPLQPWIESEEAPSARGPRDQPRPPFGATDEQ